MIWYCIPSGGLSPKYFIPIELHAPFVQVYIVEYLDALLERDRDARAVTVPQVFGAIYS